MTKDVCFSPRVTLGPKTISGNIGTLTKLTAVFGYHNTFGTGNTAKREKDYLEKNINITLFECKSNEIHLL